MSSLRMPMLFGNSWVYCAWLGMYTGEANMLLFAVLGEMMLYMLSFLRGGKMLLHVFFWNVLSPFRKVCLKIQLRCDAPNLFVEPLIDVGVFDYQLLMVLHFVILGSVTHAQTETG